VILDRWGTPVPVEVTGNLRAGGELRLQLSVYRGRPPRLVLARGDGDPVTACIRELNVIEWYSRRGLRSALLRRGEALAWAAGVREITVDQAAVEAAGGWRPGNGFWHRYGYSREGEGRVTKHLAPERNACAPTGVFTAGSV
jgi:hypothetical protein